MKKLLSTTGTIILRITVLAAFVMNIGIGNLWAEEYAVTDFNLGKEGTAVEYRTKFNTDHGKYVTIAINNEGSSKTFSDVGYISPTGKSNARIGTMGIIPVNDYRGSVTLTPAVGCYIMNYQTYLGTERLSETLEGYGYDYDAAVKVGADLSSKFESSGSFFYKTYSITWTNTQYTKKSSGNDVEISGNHKQKNPLVFNVGYFAMTILGAAIPSNRPYLKDLSTTIWVPEVSPGEDEVSMSLVKAANTSSEVVTKTYKVQHSMALGDFKYEFKNLQGEGGAAMKGLLQIVNTPSYDAIKQTLTVKFKYVSASGADFAENYAADLVISSNNEVNKNVWTTHINGSAGDRAQNNLRWNLQEPYYVNSLIEDPTFFDSDAEIIYGTSDGTIAKFEDVDSDGIKELRLLKSGPVTLSAKQEANTNYFGKELDDITITVVKRTPEFEINPTGDLYTSRTYTQYISPKSGVDPNGTMNPTYTSEDVNLFTVNDAGDVKTMAGEASKNLHVSVTSTDEWNGLEKDYLITIVRDIMHVPFCIDNQARYDRLEIDALQKSWSNSNGGTITIGTPELDISRTSTIIINISGTPDKLRIGNVTNSARGSLNAYMQVQGSSGRILLGTVTAGKEFSLDSKVYAIQIEYVGKRTASISGICITEKVDVTCAPEEITLMKVNNVINPVDLEVEYSNMTEGSMKIVAGSLAANLFTMSCDGHASSQQIDLTYADGLGVDQAPTIQVSIAYEGNPSDINLSTIQNPVATITVMGTNGDVAVEKIVNVNIGGVELTPEGLPNIIVSSTAEHPGIYTGTEKPSSTFPYCHNGKTEVNLSATFGTGGKALFDKLYIFGPTTAEGGGNTISLCTYYSQSQTHPNAITPCYIYTKAASGDRYEWTSTIPNMNPNSAEKPLANITNVNGKKLYFTGYCPYASSGSGSQVGVVYIEGGANETVDVYMQNLFLHARYHTADGSAKFAPNDTITLNLSIGTNHIPASASAFVFASTTDASSAPFSPAIHLLDSNKLDGGMGYIHASILTLHARAGLYSAPIHLYATGASRATELTIDDKWPTGAIGQTQRTNGILHLCPKDVNRPSVELGGPNSTLNFNGGRIHLKNNLPVAASEYICTFAIAYRAYSRSAAGMTATLCGMGEDQPEGNVNFNDGSIYGSMSDADFNRCQSYYHSKNSIKCPVNTQINGGTFYCDLWSCYGAGNKGGSPKNKHGDQLVMQTLPINNTPQAPYYFATIDFNAFAQNKWCFDTNHDDYNKSMAQYYAEEDDSYGTNSLKANGQNKVNIMVPYQFTDKPAIEEISSHPWAVAFPTLYISTIGQEENFGGPVTVEYSEKDRTRYLLYAEADTYTSEVTGAGYVAPNIPKAPFTDVKIEMGDSRNDVENIEEYQIEDAQYMMLPIERADRWTLFSPPFDISNVYVVEVENEATLVALAKENKRYEAYTKQATSILDLFYYFGYYTIFTQGSDPFWNTYVYWRDNTMPQGAGGAIPLKHFTGSNYDAHYYLQRSTGIWTWDGTKFTTDWEYLPSTPEKVTHGTTQYDVVMKKGEIYSLKFPYMYDGYIENNQTNWDYWTGKYLILEGIGPQRIKGKNYHATIQEAMSTAPGHAEIRVNSTLAMIPEVDLENARYLEYGREEGRNAYSSMFNPSLESKDIDPTEGFILANEPALFIPGKKAAIDLMSGTVIYEDEEEISYDTPNIVGDHSLLVYNNEDGLAIFPVNPQHVAIYNAAGQLVTKQFMSTETHVTLPAGIYFISGETERVKAMVK